MDRRLMDLGQKGFNWAKKKYEEKNQNAPAKPTAASSYAPQPSYPASGPSHGQHGGPPAHVCFQVSSRFLLDTSIVYVTRRL